MDGNLGRGKERKFGTQAVNKKKRRNKKVVFGEGAIGGGGGCKLLEQYLWYSKTKEGRLATREFSSEEKAQCRSRDTSRGGGLKG